MIGSVEQVPARSPSHLLLDGEILTSIILSWAVGAATVAGIMTLLLHRRVAELRAQVTGLTQQVSALRVYVAADELLRSESEPPAPVRPLRHERHERRPRLRLIQGGGTAVVLGWLSGLGRRPEVAIAAAGAAAVLGGAVLISPPGPPAEPVLPPAPGYERAVPERTIPAASEGAGQRGEPRKPVPPQDQHQQLVPGAVPAAAVPSPAPSPPAERPAPAPVPQPQPTSHPLTGHEPDQGQAEDPDAPGPGPGRGRGTHEAPPPGLADDGPPGR